jgi:hypothetical protein
MATTRRRIEREELVERVAMHQRRSRRLLQTHA